MDVTHSLFVATTLLYTLAAVLYMLRLSRGVSGVETITHAALAGGVVAHAAFLVSESMSGASRDPFADVHGMLSGQRYTGRTYKLGREQDRLNQPYTIEFTTDFTAADRAVDKAATPIRTAADGVQLIYYAPLAPVILPIIFLSKARDH